MIKNLIRSLVIVLTISSWSMGQTTTTRRGLTVWDPAPTSTGSLFLHNFMINVADRTAKMNLTATTDPGVGDDSDDGYATGSLWLNVTNPTDVSIWVCSNSTVGAAKWTDVTLTGGSASISDIAYAASWDGVTTIAPSKNTLYDYLSGLSTVYQAADADLTTWAGVTSSANGRSLVSAENYAAMKTLLAYGTMADQNANSVAITGGSINGAAIGGTTPAAGAFTTLYANSLLANVTTAAYFDDRFYVYVDRIHSTNVLRRGFFSQVRINPAVEIVQQSVGVYGKIITQTGTSTVNDIVGTIGEVQHNADGIVTSAKGLSSSVIETAGGTITNGYGVYINDLTGQITNAYGIYQVGTEQNRFGGELAVASNTAGIKLNASGTTTIVSDTSNLTLTDPTTGAKTLAQLATDTDTLGSIGSVANGDVLIYNSGWKRLGKGDDGQVLKLATGLPAWAADNNTTYTGGDGLTLTETDFDLDLKTGGGLEIDTGQLTVTAPLLIGEIGLSWHGTAAEVIDDAVVCPYSGTITSVIITANASGNIELDVWKSASGVPTVADTICNASYPALSAAQQDKAISVAGWSSTAITAGDTIKFEVRSVSTITQATVQLVIAK